MRSWILGASAGLGAGLGALGSGRWVLGAGLWALGAGLWALGAGRWALGSGLWALGAGRWALVETLVETLVEARRHVLYVCTCCVRTQLWAMGAAPCCRSVQKTASSMAYPY